MKYSLKNEYKELLNEVRVSIETPDNFYDYEFPDDTNFRNLSFYDDKQLKNTNLVRIIPKTTTSTSNFNRKKALYGVKIFINEYLNKDTMQNIYNYYVDNEIDKSSTKNIEDFNSNTSNDKPQVETEEFKSFENMVYNFVGGSLSYFIIQILKNILISDRKVYGELISHYKSEKSNALPVEILKNCISKKLDNNNIILNTLKEISIFKQPRKSLPVKVNISFFTVFEKILKSDDIKNIIEKSSKIKEYLEFYFKERSRELGDAIVTPEIWPVIAREYITNSNEALSILLREIQNYNESNSDNINIRQNVKTLDELEVILNKINSIENIKSISSSYPPANRKGRGEFLCHMLFNTQNACLSIEPDVLLPNGINLSVKSSFSGDARTGENMDLNVRDLLNQIILIAMPNLTSRDISFLTTSTLNTAFLNAKKNISDVGINKIEEVFREVNSKNYNHIKVETFRDLYNSLKIEITTEHDATGIIRHNRDDSFSLIRKEQLNGPEINLSALKNNRWSFDFATSSGKSFENAFSKLISELDKELEELEFYNQEVDQANRDSYLDSFESHFRKGKVLKEVYSHLFKKKLISEGGLAGHMMHPYEALDMTPRQIIDRIKEYSTSQKIIEKVDGQNLFFTVEQDGTLMFARNKEDMTHDDLVTKFTGHPAELPFVEGGNAIKRGVEQWLSSAGPAAEMEIREIFHPDGETRSFINFEIMHPDKPNQIIYDEKYIVFHSIVDYIDGRKTVYSTNKGQRLEKLIKLMDSGISSSGFTLASNRTVNLNQLTNVQIEDYVERVKEVALSLGIPETITLGEGIENIIKKEIDSLGIDLDRETLKKIYDFVLYGEDRLGNKIKSKDFTSSLVKSDVAGLRSLDLTNASKALKKVQSIISPFKDVFVDLGIDLLRGVKSAYMSDETNQKNIELLRDKLQTAIDDLIDYMNENPENYWEPEVHRLRQHLDKVIDKDITDIVATTIEGGVYDYQGDLIKVTGGFAPLNQILGAAYRDKKGIFPTFKQKFMQQESNRRSLKSIFNLIF